MVLVILLPIFALIALSVVVVVQAVNTRNDAKDSQDAINIFLKIDKIVTAFGVCTDVTVTVFGNKVRVLFQTFSLSIFLLYYSMCGSMLAV